MYQVYLYQYQKKYDKIYKKNIQFEYPTLMIDE